MYGIIPSPKGRAYEKRFDANGNKLEN